MILPSKHIPPSRALLTIGAVILRHLDQPRTISVLWDAVRIRDALPERGRIGYDWFILGIDLLFLLKAIEYRNGTLLRLKP
jgi:hypothetical protein